MKPTTPESLDNRSTRGPWVALCLLALAKYPGFGKPDIRDAFFQNYPSVVGSILDPVPSQPGHCGVYHYKFTDRDTRHPYGEAVKNTVANSNAIRQIRLQDSDGDGLSDLEEITDTIIYANTPAFPGLSKANMDLVI